MIDGKIKKIMYFSLISLSFISFIIVFLTNDYSNCSFLCLLPLFFFIGVLLFSLVNKKNDLYLGTFIIIISYFIRMVLTPIFMCFGNYFDYKDSSLPYDNAVLFMIYEFIFVFMILILYNKKKRYPINSLEQKNKNLNEEFNITKSLKYILIILMLICFVFCILYPQILNSFKIGILSNSKLIQWQIKYNLSLNSTPKLIFYLVSWCIKVLKEVIIFSILLYIKRKNKTKDKNIISFLVSIIIVLIGTLISDDTLAQNIYFAFIYFLLLTEFYPRYKKSIYYILGFTICFIFFFGLFNEKIANGNFQEISYNIANTLQVYFTGVYNVAVSLKLEVSNPFKIILGDVLRSIPLFKTFFVNMETSTTVFCSYINDKYNSQIVPSLGQSIFFVGKLFAPIISVIFTFLALKYEREIKNKKNYFDKFIYYVIIVKLSCIPVIYNAQIFLQGFFGLILPLLLINLFNKRRYNYD